MNWNDWEIVWKGQQLSVGPKADVAEVARSFEAKCRKSSRAVLFRNVAEGGTGLVGSFFIGWLACRHGAAGWPLWMSAVLFVGITAVFLTDFAKNWRHPIPIEATLLARVDAQIVMLRNQRRLMASWWAWYLIPGVAGIVFGFFGLSRLNYGKAPPGLLMELVRTPTTAAWIFILCAVVCVFLFQALRAVHNSVRDIDRHVAELEKLRNDAVSTLESGGAEG